MITQENTITLMPRHLEEIVRILKASKPEYEMHKFLDTIIQPSCHAFYDTDGRIMLANTLLKKLNSDDPVEVRIAPTEHGIVWVITRHVCDKCQSYFALSPHSCPYAEAIEDDYDDDYCTCCDDCTSNCAMDI